MIFYKAATVAAMLIVLEAPGGHALIIVDTPNTYLYLVLGQADDLPHPRH